MRNILLASLLLITSWLGAQRLSVIEVETFEEYQEVLGIATAKNQLLFIIINEPRVPILKGMIENDVFKNTQLLAEMKNTVPCIIEVDDDMGERFVEVFAIDSVPAFLFMDTSETLLAYEQGEETSASLLKALNLAKKNQTLYPQLQQAYVNKTLTLEQWPQLLEVYTQNRPYNESRNLVMQYLALLNRDQLFQPKAIEYASTYGLSLETTYPRLLLTNTARASQAYPAFNVNDYFTAVYNFNVDLAILNKDSILLNKVVDVLIPLTNSGKPAVLVLETEKLFAEETGQFKVYRKAVLNYALKGSDTLVDTTEYIYDEAFYLADTYGDDKQALRASKQLSTAANKLSPEFRYQMLSGYMSYKLNEFDEAKKWVEMAKVTTQISENKTKADTLLKMISRAKEEEKKPGQPLGGN